MSDSHHPNAERAAENVYLRLIARYAMAAALPIMGFIAIMGLDAQKAAVRQEEKIMALSARVEQQIGALADRGDRQVTSLTTLLNSRIDAQGRRIDDMGGELGRLRDYTYRVYPGARAPTTPTPQ